MIRICFGLQSRVNRFPHACGDGPRDFAQAVRQNGVPHACADDPFGNGERVSMAPVQSTHHKVAEKQNDSDGAMAKREAFLQVSNTAVNLAFSGLLLFALPEQIKDAVFRSFRPLVSRRAAMLPLSCVTAVRSASKLDDFVFLRGLEDGFEQRHQTAELIVRDHDFRFSM